VFLGVFWSFFTFRGCFEDFSDFRGILAILEVLEIFFFIYFRGFGVILVILVILNPPLYKWIQTRNFKINGFENKAFQIY
jgi:hypothetical protein